MGFRFNKRINLGKGLGFNVSKSGISPSVRTKIGSFSSKGFSVKTGISGVSYRKSNNSKGCLLVITFYVSLGVVIFKIIN